MNIDYAEELNLFCQKLGKHTENSLYAEFYFYPPFKKYAIQKIRTIRSYVKAKEQINLLNSKMKKTLKSNTEWKDTWAELEVMHLFVTKNYDVKFLKEEKSLSTPDFEVQSLSHSRSVIEVWKKFLDVK